MGLSELSGRVSTLETNVTFLNQDILLRPDLAAFSAYQQVWNQQISDISDSITLLQTQVSNLQSLYTNIVQTVSSNLAVLTGHTGLLTGDGVHGH